MDLEFLHHGVPRLELNAEWNGPAHRTDLSSQAQTPSLDKLEESLASFSHFGRHVLLSLLEQPNIASKEWLIRQYDHEVQGTSVIKPMHTAWVGTPYAWSGPNDGGVIKPKPSSDLGLAVGCGINPKLSDIDPFLMAQSAVDEAIRNVLCVGAEYGTTDSVLALVDNFCWPDPVQDSKKMGWLVRACQGLRDAALQLSAPLISGKDSMKNDFRGKKNGEMVSISVPPTLLMTAVARVPDIKGARTSDFKAPGDVIYLIGPSDFGILGSELRAVLDSNSDIHAGISVNRVGMPSWNSARKVYSWMGGAVGKFQSRLKSLHDISDGGLLVAVAECLISRGLGAQMSVPVDRDAWEFAFGEGFHAFVGTASKEDASQLEAEWDELGVSFKRIGTVENHERLEVMINGSGKMAFSLGIKQLRSAWSREGYWE